MDYSDDDRIYIGCEILSEDEYDPHDPDHVQHPEFANYLRMVEPFLDAEGIHQWEQQDPECRAGFEVHAFLAHRLKEQALGFVDDYEE